MSSRNQFNGIYRVEEFLASLESISWLSRVGRPTAEDESLFRINIDFVLAHHADFIMNGIGDEYEYWGDFFFAEEAIHERIIFDRGLLGEQAKINSFIDKLRIEFDDDFYSSLEERFDGYYGDTCSYAHELLFPSSIKRYVRGAAFELLVSDFDSTPRLYRDLMPWIRRGHWPYGWKGEYPQGKLMLF
jgi:hypothetical protein